MYSCICFNPRARVGRDQPIRATGVTTGSFNPRARVGRDLIRAIIPCSRRCFNPRARVGRDSSVNSETRMDSRFNPRARVGRDLPLSADVVRVNWFQSTRPCGARQRSLDLRFGGRQVSIHAPVWGATRMRGVDDDGLKVSIHAPVWGATSLRVLGRRRPGRFNPRARVGRDQALPEPLTRITVSIHAPVWGATANLRWVVVDTEFQSTRPCGARLEMARKGYAIFKVSIHAPVWGATISR